MLLAEMQLRIEGKKGEMDLMNFKELMKEFRGLLHAIKKPASSLQMVQIPMTSQRSVDTVVQSRRRLGELKDPHTLKLARESQRAYLEGEGA